MTGTFNKLEIAERTISMDANLTDIELAVARKSKQLIKRLYAKYNEAYLKEKFPDVFKAMGDFVKPINGYTKEIRNKNDLGWELEEKFLKCPSETKLNLRKIYCDWYIQESCQQVVCRKLEKLDDNLWVLFKATSQNNYYELLVDLC